MAFRSLKLQGLTILLGLSIFAVGTVAFDLDPGESDTIIYMTVFVVSYFVLVAGAHLYMAIRGESGDVPVDSHWRFVGVVALLLGLGLIGWTLKGVQPIAGVDPAFVVGMVALAVMVGYVSFDAREGYRAVTTQ